MRLQGLITTPDALTARQRARMFELMAAHFDGTSRSAFARDLAEKEWVVLLRDVREGTIQGFSTLMRLEAIAEGRRIQAVFSGDTIVDRRYWGEPTLANLWAGFVLELAESQPGAPLYWFLISKGHRTYRYLPLYFRSFYPRFDQPTPPFYAAAIAALAERKFPGCYDRHGGVLRFPGAKDRLKADLASVPAGRLNNPHVRYFLDRNPGYRQGDELACIAEIARANFQPHLLAGLAGAQAAGGSSK